MKKLMICAVLAAGCADTASEPPAGEPILLTTPEPEAAERADLYVAPHTVDLVMPDVVACEETSMIGAPDLMNTDVSEPVMTEHLGADGCVDERWIREWDGTRPLSENYDWFDPTLAEFTYVAPFAYHHIWTYDEDGRLVRQDRESREGDPDHETWFEETEYDEQGRVVRQARSGSLLQPTMSWVHEELWTYGPNSDEFETHTTISNGEVYDIVRQVFASDGTLIEKYRTYVYGGQPERMTLRRELDAGGNVVVQETWDATTGNPGTHTVYERRADGTLEREVSKNLVHGWLDVTTYDAVERELVYTQDENDDGVIEYRKETRYDATGNVVFTSTEYDFDRPRTRYTQVVSTYDGQNRLVEEVSTPVWMHGKSRRTTNTYDAHGTGHTSSLDILDEQGNHERTEYVAHHIAPGQVVWERHDADRDGTLDSLTIRRWAGERPLQTLVDNDDDGVVDFIEQWHYDAAGQLVLHAQDSDADTVIDSAELHAR